MLYSYHFLCKLTILPLMWRTNLCIFSLIIDTCIWTFCWVTCSSSPHKVLFWIACFYYHNPHASCLLFTHSLYIPFMTAVELTIWLPEWLKFNINLCFYHSLKSSVSIKLCKSISLFLTYMLLLWCIFYFYVRLKSWLFFKFFFKIFIQICPDTHPYSWFFLAPSCFIYSHFLLPPAQFLQHFLLHNCAGS